MTIVRDEKEIELTDCEIRKAYYEFRHQMYIEDIEMRLQERSLHVDKAAIKAMADCARTYITHNELYWECYWDSLDLAIDRNLP